MAFACVASLLFSVTGASAQQAPREFPKISLPAETYGPDAITALGNKLPAVAAWYGMTAEDLRRRFLGSSFAHMDRGDGWITHLRVNTDGRLGVYDALRSLTDQIGQLEVVRT